MSKYTAQQAAAAIVELINASPRSPRQDEIEAIMAGTALPKGAAAMRLPNLSADHLEYRRLVAAGERVSRDSVEEDEEALRAASEEIIALEKEIWATPAKTPADVLLRAEIALYNENGVMASLEDADGYQDERATAQLIKAVIDVLGGLNAR